MINQTQSPAQENGLHIGHLGGEGSYSRQAAEKAFPEVDSYVSHRTFDEIFFALEKGHIDHGVVPIENSSTGSIRDVYDLLVKCRLHITGEIHVSVNHHLLGLPGVRVQDIRTVCSHPQAILQSSDYIRLKGFETHYVKDTDSAAALVKDSANPALAAIASSRAADRHGLDILERHINNRHYNTTRFLILSSMPDAPEEKGVTSFVFTTRHEPGCLYAALKDLADHAINMLRIESRPIENRPWEYYFFVDVEGSINESRIRTALSKLAGHTNFMRILGSYKRTDL